MDFDNSAQVEALALLPPEPVKAAPKWNGWSAPLRAVPAAAAETLAGAAEVVTGVARQIDYERRTPFKRGQVMSGAPAFDGRSDVSDSLRNAAELYAPDPATASTAENVVFQLTRGFGKALGYGLSLGPVGLGLFAADEGLTEADRLQRQGVDAQTARQAGIVTALATGAGAVVPVAPLAKGFTAANVGKVTGLAAVSGPATFAAQQQMTRSILEHANYGEIARHYDPLDPLGLTLSTVAPWAFGMTALRGGAKTGKPGAPKSAEPGQIGPPVAERPQGEAKVAEAPAEAVDAAMVHNLTLQRTVREARAAEIAAETVRPIESLREFVARTGFKPEPMPTPPKSGFLRWVRDNGGLGMEWKTDITGEPSGVRSNPGGIFRRGGASPDDLATRAADEGYLPADLGQDSGAFVELVKRAVAGDPPLTLEQTAQRGAFEAAQTEREYRVAQLERRLEVLGVDPAAAQGNARTLDAYLKQHEESLLAAALDEATAAPAPEPKPRSDVVQRAMQAAEDLRDSGDTPEVFLSKGNLPPEVRNLVVGLAEAGANTKRAEGMLADFERTIAARPEAAPMDVAADVVEASRAGNFVTPEPAKAPKATDPVAQSIADRVQAIEQNMSELQVDDGKTAGEFMAEARRQAREGTADELGMLDADLVRVAGECALMTGMAA